MTSSQEISEESIYLMVRANLFLESQEHRLIISFFLLYFEKQYSNVDSRRTLRNYFTDDAS